MRRKYRANRRAAAAVELAICLPVVVLIVLSSIEGASMIFLRQALCQSSYEAVKAAVKHRGTEQEAIDRGNDVLAGRSIDGAEFEFSVKNVEQTKRGNDITVTVSAPANQNSILPFGPFKDRRIEVSATMIKE